MKKLYILFYLVSLSIFAEGPTYNFNFYNPSNKEIQNIVKNPDSSSVVIKSTKIINKTINKNEQWHFNLGFLQLNGQNKDLMNDRNSYDLKIIGLNLKHYDLKTISINTNFIYGKKLSSGRNTISGLGGSIQYDGQADFLGSFGLATRLGLKYLVYNNGEDFSPSEKSYLLNGSIGLKFNTKKLDVYLMANIASSLSDNPRFVGLNGLELNFRYRI